MTAPPERDSRVDGLQPVCATQFHNHPNQHSPRIAPKTAALFWRTFFDSRHASHACMTIEDVRRRRSTDKLRSARTVAGSRRMMRRIGVRDVRVAGDERRVRSSRPQDHLRRVEVRSGSEKALSRIGLSVLLEYLAGDDWAGGRSTPRRRGESLREHGDSAKHHPDTPDHERGRDGASLPAR